MDRVTSQTITEWSPGRFALVATSLLVATFVAVSLLSPPRNMAGDMSLAIITGTAVGIERTIEVFWTFLAFRLGSWWPLQGVTARLNTLIGDLNNQYLNAFVSEAQRKISEAHAAGIATIEDVDAANKALTDLKSTIDGWPMAAPDNQRLRALVSLVSNRINYLGDKVNGLRDAADVAVQAVGSISDFVDSFKDNPGRRVISIYLGALIGMVSAGVLGMDIFKAVLDSTPTIPSLGLIRVHLGVAITGLVIGLGSSPTHEVIRLLTEIKKQRRTENNRDSNS